MYNWPVIIEILLSVAVMGATAYHAVLVMHQKLSYFHSVRYLLLSSYILFGTVVASETVLSQVSDVNLASLMLKMEISAVIVAAILLSISATVLTLQAKGHEFPYRALFNSPPLGLVLTSSISIFAFISIWSIFNFKFIVGEKVLLGVTTLIPQQDIVQIGTLALVFLGFVWHQTKLLSKDIITLQPASLSKVIRSTGLLWIVLSTTLFMVNGTFRTMGIDVVEFGHLLDSMVLGILAYIYAKPTTLLEFFASGSPLANELKRKHFTKVFDFDIGIGKKVLLEVDSVSDYIELVHYFLSSGPKPGICITYKGSSILPSDLENSAFKVVELSMSADRITVSKGGTVEAPLFKKSVYDLLKWSIECNAEGRLVLDGLTHFIQLLGIDEVYSIVSYISELCTRNGVQLLLILNYQVHKLEVISAFEGMADHVIQFERNRAKQVRPYTSVTRPVTSNDQSKPSQPKLE
ncbi:MAG: hypothetical protein HYU02_02165 [Thaumarchaeota archaeon]|nr:hypothetical protein [Nitrososphaerota archaeon]